MAYIYIGAKGKINVVDAGTGKTVKEIELNTAWIKSGNGFVNMVKSGNSLYAHAYGRLYCVDIGTGRVLWSNELKGMGFDPATLVTDDDNNAWGNAAAARSVEMDERRRRSD